MKVKGLDATRDGKTNAIIFNKRKKPSEIQDTSSLEKRITRLENRIKILESKI